MEYCDNKKCINTFNRYSIPEIKTCYYYFLDRHPDTKNSFDDSNLNNRYSYNFSLALFDDETKIIYYYELDT